MQTKNYNEDTARQKPKRRSCGLIRQFNCSRSVDSRSYVDSTIQVVRPLSFRHTKLDVLLRARSTSSRPVLRSPQFRLYKRHKYEIPKLPQNNST